jgi:hypothetical protein
MIKNIVVSFLIAIGFAILFYLVLSFCYSTFDASKFDREAKGLLCAAWMLCSGVCIGLWCERDFLKKNSGT